LIRLLALLLAALPLLCCAQDVLTIGSKRFTESYVLGAIIAQVARAAGEARVVYRSGLGNTGIVFAALRSGSIDLYPEYTGTIAQELLNGKARATLGDLSRALAPLGLGVAIPFGFSDNYALAMSGKKAAALGIHSISDLIGHAGLRLGLSQEFMNRRDGWPALKAAYHLPFTPVGLDHGLAYAAVAAGDVDVIDSYSTDPQIEKYHLRVLADDRHFFPAYDAVVLYRLGVPQRFPRTWAALQKLAGSIDAQQMITMNAAAELHGQSFDKIAASFVHARADHTTVSAPRRTPFITLLLGGNFWQLTLQHLMLVFLSLALSVVLGMPLGVWAAKSRIAGRWVLPAAGVLQTIPALALLAFLIPVTHRIGTVPAVIALFLYALLPIVRNTYTGLADIAPSLQESARALGLPPAARLRLIELPLAARSILAGIKTSAVINVGTATIAAFIGAGGYGERIAAGLAVNDNRMLLAGAIPAAVMALVVQGAFGLLDRWLISEGLRIDAAGEKA
jgi:osmoprotectant transport system permease protein